MNTLKAERAMTTSDKLREFAEKWGWFVKAISLDNHRFELNKDPEKCLSDLTALISEHYVEKAKYDEAVRQRDELRERCKQLEFMIEKGLGWDDVKNDISMPHEL